MQCVRGDVHASLNGRLTKIRRDLSTIFLTQGQKSYSVLLSSLRHRYSVHCASITGVLFCLAFHVSNISLRQGPARPRRPLPEEHPRLPRHSGRQWLGSPFPTAMCELTPLPEPPCRPSSGTQPWRLQGPRARLAELILQGVDAALLLAGRELEVVPLHRHGRHFLVGLLQLQLQTLVGGGELGHDA